MLGTQHAALVLQGLTEERVVGCPGVILKMGEELAATPRLSA